MYVVLYQFPSAKENVRKPHIKMQKSSKFEKKNYDAQQS